LHGTCASRKTTIKTPIDGSSIRFCTPIDGMTLDSVIMLDSRICTVEFPINERTLRFVIMLDSRICTVEFPIDERTLRFVIMLDLRMLRILANLYDAVFVMHLRIIFAVYYEKFIEVCGNNAPR